MIVQRTRMVRLPRGSDGVRDAVFSPDGLNRGFLGLIYPSAPPVVLSLTTGGPVELPIVRPVTSLAFRPQDTPEFPRTAEMAYVHGSESARVYRWDLTLDCPLEELQFPRPLAVSYSWEGTMLAAGSATGRLGVWSMMYDSPVKESLFIQVSHSGIVRLAFTRCGDKIFILTAAGEVYCVNTLSSQVAFRYSVFEAGDADPHWDCWASACHPEANVAAFAGSADKGKQRRCKVWFVHTLYGDRHSIITSQRRFIRHLRFLDDEHLAIIGDQGAEVWNLNPVTPKLVEDASRRCKVIAGHQLLEELYLVAAPRDPRRAVQAV